MFGTGFLAGLLAKLAGLGSMAKLAVATTTAALTMTVVGASTGVVPFSGNHPNPGITQGATGTTVDTGTSTSAESHDTGVTATGDASLTTPAGSGSTGAHAAVGTPATSGLSTSSSSSASTSSSAAATSASNPAATSGTGLPDVSGLTQVPGQVLACLTPVLDLVKSLPTAGVGGGGIDQITRIGPTVVACVTGIVKSLPLPSGLNTCVSQILTFVRGLAAQAPTGVPDLGGLDLASCIPAGLPVPGMPGGLPFMGGGFPFGG
ncbi:MAG TPA: hypothetical protein VHS52_05445 [Acidimicrobiales bacterium]|jgi:hypothetical protein|nr:hypothetical protein [Acidimicrobiales bacterium]